MRFLPYQTGDLSRVHHLHHYYHHLNHHNRHLGHHLYHRPYHLCWLWSLISSVIVVIVVIIIIIVIMLITFILVIFVGYDQWRRRSEKSCKVSKTLFDLRGNRNWSKKLRRAITKFKQKQNSTEIWANLDENTLTGGSRNCNILDYIQSSRWGTRWRGNHELWGGKSWREIKHYYII